MNNLEKAIETLGELLDEMSDKMDVDANGDPDNAMRWATQVSDAVVRLRRHAKADTKTHTDLCQEAQAEPVARYKKGTWVQEWQNLVPLPDGEYFLYIHPAQATPPLVVPEELLASDAPAQYNKQESYAWANGYNACRAAILAAQEVGDERD